MWINQVVLAFLGLCSGFSVAAGVFAFIAMLGVIPRFAARTHTATHLYLYERAVIWGGTLGNIWILWETHLPLSVVLVTVYGLCSGIFVGCLAMALAEMLRVVPILTNRLQLKEGFPILMISISLAKMAGTIFQYFF